MFLLSALVIGAASASPRRLVISGSTVASSEEPSVPIILKGFNFGFEQGALPVTEQDRNITSIFPGANLARLVMNHWHDKACCDDDAGVCDRPGCSHEAAVSGQLGGDCDSNNESLGFLTAPCLSMFDNVVQWFTDDVKGWVVLTARAALAAGDGGDGHTVFTNATLRKQMIAMWAFLARRYRNTSGVAGYEVMSEPRTKNDHEVVHRFQADACRAVWEEDPAAVCFLGPAPFYDRWHLGPDYLISGGPVVYVANFLCPNFWIKGAYKGVAYGESGRCCDIGNSKDCPTGCDTNITLNRAYLESQLAPIDDFRKKHNVSVWVDQWGVGQDIGGGSSHFGSSSFGSRDLGLSWFTSGRAHFTWHTMANPMLRGVSSVLCRRTVTSPATLARRCASSAPPAGARGGREAAQAVADAEGKVAEEQGNVVKQWMRGPAPVVIAFGAAYWWMNQPKDASGVLKQSNISIRIFGPNMPM